MKNSIDLSIVVPVFNEEDNIFFLYERIRDVCDSLQHTCEMVFIDDGSQDQTLCFLTKVHQQDSRVKVIQFRKNYGQTPAMAAGFRAAKGKIIVSMDGDLQNDPKDIPRLLQKLDEGYDVVCGWRKDRKDKLISRKIPSKIANWLISKITGVPIHDNGCSLKAYRKEVIKQVSLYSELHRFIPAMSTLTGARIAEIVVTHHARQFGTSKYGISRAWRVFLDLFLIKMLTGFSENPLLWFGIFGVPVGLWGTLCFSWLLFSHIPGYILPSIGLLLFCLASHLIVMGVLGEIVLHTGDFRPNKMKARTAIKVIGAGDRG
jgi:glycosyltransferase involved in cell wall biosynthesis